MALNQNDRLFINTENVRRASNNLAPLSLDQMADALIGHQADKLAFNSNHQTVYMAQEIEQEEFPVKYVPENKQRGNGRFMRGKNMSNNKHFQKTQGGPAGNQIVRGAPPNRTMRGGRAPQGKRNGEYRAPFVTCQMANVERGACIMCGEKGHLFKDDRCIYSQEPLMPSPCRHCLVGCHPHTKCQNNIRQKPDYWPTQRM